MSDLNGSGPDRDVPNRDAELNRALEAMYYGFRAFIARPDQLLGEHALARVHHRILYFIARNPDCSVSELLQKLKATKQYIHPPLRRLVEEGYVVSRPDGLDRRVKRLALSVKGAALEKELSGIQRDQFERIFREVGPESERGWKAVMALLAREMPG